MTNSVRGILAPGQHRPPPRVDDVQDDTPVVLVAAEVLREDAATEAGNPTTGPVVAAIEVGDDCEESAAVLLPEVQAIVDDAENQQQQSGFFGGLNSYRLPSSRVQIIAAPRRNMRNRNHHNNNDNNNSNSNNTSSGDPGRNLILFGTVGCVIVSVAIFALVLAVPSSASTPRLPSSYRVTTDRQLADLVWAVRDEYISLDHFSQFRVSKGVTNLDRLFHPDNFPVSSPFETNLQDWDTSTVTSMNEMFHNSTVYFRGHDRLEWDTSAVTSMRGMFQYYHMYVPDISSWDTSRVTDMSHLFQGTKMLKSRPKRRYFNVTNVRNMTYMFESAEWYLSSGMVLWDVSRVNDFSHMFANSRSLSPVPYIWLRLWNVSGATSMRGMFSGDLVNISYLKTWDTSRVTDMSYMFNNSTIHTNQSDRVVLELDWDTSHVTSMRRMFYASTNLNVLQVNKWNVSKVTDFTEMFAGTKFQSPICSWNEQVKKQGVKSKNMLFKTDCEEAQCLDC